MKEMEQEKEDRRQAKWWTKAEAERYKVGGSTKADLEFIQVKAF